MTITLPDFRSPLSFEREFFFIKKYFFEVSSTSKPLVVAFTVDENFFCSPYHQFTSFFDDLFECFIDGMPALCFDFIRDIVWIHLGCKSSWTNGVASVIRKIKLALLKGLECFLKHLVCFSTKSNDYVSRYGKKRILFTQISNYFFEIIVSMLSVHTLEHSVTSWLEGKV